ncbi:rho GTPase-activating protein 5-like [Cynara cardunculus var. scolymus]|uniref:PAK-box/P21-Rho-binding n=1 Tax=Cynara cardunculus var. scolymus TaxID=59895 RepID=A0A103XUX5_CYNCS|nr:rho GTPase-activating protein 5-like [Cynara cardunculus var. scolymus]KVH97305.1 PAK-box/P21-Rho-binding [Cynara cardunculus var. scolymus]
MTTLFRSKSCGGTPRPKASFFHFSTSTQQEEDDDDDDHDDIDVSYLCQDYSEHGSPITTPFISPRQQSPQSNHNFTILSLLLTALRKSLLTCAVQHSQDASSSLDIGCPTDVHHVSHVTFDRFNGFLGLPHALQPHVPRHVPSASVCVFGVSVESMQCSYDERGNSVPTILLMMQNRLYSGGGLQAEGIFRINGENGEEEIVRKQLNRGFVPHGVDVHCLAGLIKAWFRELPTGVLDSLTPEQVMHCNTEEECTQLAKSLPPTEAALLDWAINLMADVVKYDQENKMNARNIAMVFAPNMTQMADPLTALIHAVQIMNLLKTLVMKTLGDREESCADNSGSDHLYPLRSSTLNRLGSESEEQFWSFPRKSGSVVEYDYNNSPVTCRSKSPEIDNQSKQGQQHREVVIEGILERVKLRKGVRRLCRYPVFQLSKPTAKKSGTIGEDMDIHCL